MKGIADVLQQYTGVEVSVSDKEEEEAEMPEELPGEEEVYDYDEKEPMMEQMVEAYWNKKLKPKIMEKLNKK